MKLVTFDIGRDQHIGAMRENLQEAVDFTSSDSGLAFKDMISLIEAGPEALAAARNMLSKARTVIPLNGLKLRAPLPRPTQMRDFLAYEKHIRQARANRYLLGEGSGPIDPSAVSVPRIWYERPIYYKCNRMSVSGPDDTILWPKYTQRLDYELELAFVISKSGCNISQAQAHEHIFGYMIFNDFSARDIQIAEMAVGLGPSKGKDFDTSNALGPWLVTSDEIDDPYALEMTARINGVEASRSGSGEIQHSFEAMIVYTSEEETLFPGEVFGAGTVGGGCGLERGKFLSRGDTVELAVEGLGVLRNFISRPEAGHDGDSAKSA